MTILQSLAGYYDRMAARGEAEPPGFKRVAIETEVTFDAGGALVAVSDRRERVGKKFVASKLDVPAGGTRTSGVMPFFLWDKTAYSLGVTAGEGKRTAQEHQAFKDLHARMLAGTQDDGLLALLRFLDQWQPERFGAAPFAADMVDTNVVFRLDGDVDEEGRPRRLHERPAAVALVEAQVGEGADGLCLVSGMTGPIARLHPMVKGVDGAQMAGASLVSFNAQSYESWGHKDGANAPTGEAATFRYGAALNRLLDRGSRNRAQLVGYENLDPDRRRSAEVRHRQRFSIGDATTIFWADAAGLKEELLAQAEVMAAVFAVEPIRDDDDVTLSEDSTYAQMLREQVDELAKGRPVKIGTDSIPPTVKIHFLGLAPNAARLSVRFWITQTLGELARHALLHHAHCKIDPPPRGWGSGPSINVLLVRTTAAQEKWDNIPPLLAGEVARAVLGGTPYPRTLLFNAIMRLRAGDDPAGGWHAAVIRAVLMRSGGGAPVKLDVVETNPGYRLGRLFAVLEEAQERALGRVNATIRDRYFGAASATPASVFPLLLRGVQNHLGKLRKDEPGSAQSIEIKLGDVIGGLGTELPRSLKLEDQGRFAIGYYHQRSDRFRKRDTHDQANGDQGDTDA